MTDSGKEPGISDPGRLLDKVTSHFSREAPDVFQWLLLFFLSMWSLERIPTPQLHCTLIWRAANSTVRESPESLQSCLRVMGAAPEHRPGPCRLLCIAESPPLRQNVRAEKTWRPLIPFPHLRLEKTEAQKRELSHKYFAS